MKMSIKVCFVSLIVLAFVVAGTAGAAFDVKHLLIYWNCDEGSGEKLKDSSGRGYDGAVMGKGAKWVKGMYGGGVQLTKTYVEGSGDGKLLDPIDATKQISFGCWISLGAHSTYNGIISILSAAEGDCCDFRLMIDPAKSPFWNAGLHVDQNLDGKYTFDLNKWHHFAITMDGTSKVYVDGKLIGEVKEANEPPAYKKVTFWLGTGEGPATWLIEDSTFDDVFAADKALTPDEIKTIMDGNFMAVGSQGKLATTWAGLKSK